MSSATTIALVASAVIAAGSTAYSAYAASEAADEQAKLQEQQANMEMEAAQKEAEQIKEKARRLKATQTAQLAGAGVKVDGGTSGALLEETDRLSEQDALAALKEGKNRADLLRQGANISRGQSQASLIGGALGTAGTIMNGVASYQKATANARAANNINLAADEGRGFVSRSGNKYSILGGNYSLR
jgi:hypothetical protein